MVILVGTCVALGALVLTLVGGGADALAHGKQIQLEVRSEAAPDVDPLARDFTVVAAFQDRDPVEDADALLEATALSGTGSVEVSLSEDLTIPGTYTATVVFTSAGEWDVVVTMSNSFGEGSATFVQTVVAPDGPEPEPSGPGSVGPGAADPGALDPDAAILTQITFRFGATDIANIAVRVLHFVAAVAWTALIAALLVGFAWLGGDRRVAGPAARWTRRLAPALLVVMAGSGILQAWRNAPNTGGFTELSVLQRLPFSEVYLGLLALKVVLFLMAGALLWALRRRVRPFAEEPPPEATDAASDDETEAAAVAGVARLAWISFGALTLAYGAVLLMNYFHLVSHLAEFYL